MAALGWILWTMNRDIMSKDSDIFIIQLNNLCLLAKLPFCWKVQFSLFMHFRFEDECHKYYALISTIKRDGTEQICSIFSRQDRFFLDFLILIPSFGRTKLQKENRNIFLFFYLRKKMYSKFFCCNFMRPKTWKNQYWLHIVRLF